MRLSALFPLACAIVAFVLSMLCLFAGHKPGFMEEYHIVTLNTSTLGHNILSTATTSSGPTPTATSIGSFFSSIAHNVSSTIEGDINGIIGDVADKLAKELGIKQWYSLHLMDLCEGTFTPNATEKGASLNVSTCSNQTAMYHFDISKQLNKELEIGPLHINLSTISWPSEIQDGLNALNTALDATFVLYAIGIAAAGCAILASLVAFFLHGSRLISFGNWGLATISFLSLLIASIIITVIQSKATNLINKYGNEIGVYAYKGQKYLILTWVAVAVMFLAMLAWVAEFCVGKRNRGREYTEKSSRHGWGRSRKSDEAALRRSGV
ncbi:hypothetical protein NA56DRAFT_704886 [Hyaloscypha hepaticicola]|uniref:Sur7 protein n=1 Tax=Hyaloscypha hepaticicola TaxID=2082293 RepID=A0A2J6Q1C4_9HELO|nr:hypothetical protein NA56DRAFT_704886 [Hyaloscypha hepaticicola]